MHEYLVYYMGYCIDENIYNTITTTHVYVDYYHIRKNCYDLLAMHAVKC